MAKPKSVSGDLLSINRISLTLLVTATKINRLGIFPGLDLCQQSESFLVDPFGKVAIITTPLPGL